MRIFGREKINLGPWILVSAVCLLFMGQGADSLADSSWQRIDEGFEVKFLQVEGEPYQSLIKLRILRVDPGKFPVKVLESRTFGASKLEIKELAKRAQALAAINGGFFQPDYRPLGLLIVDGKEVNPLRNADWGIFLIQEDQPRIIHTKEYQKNGNIS
jgi:hypothetical protein